MIVLLIAVVIALLFFRCSQGEAFVWDVTFADETFVLGFGLGLSEGPLLNGANSEIDVDFDV